MRSVVGFMKDTEATKLCKEFEVVPVSWLFVSVISCGLVVPDLELRIWNH